MPASVLVVGEPRPPTLVARTLTAPHTWSVELSRETAAWLGAIVQSSSDAIISKTLDGIVSSWNPAAEHLFGYTADEAIGQPITLIIPVDQRTELVGIMDRLKRGEPIDLLETVRMRKDGSRVPVSLSISPVRDATGRIVGAAKVSRDMTQALRDREQVAGALVRTETALRQARDVAETATAEANNANRQTSELYAALALSEARFRSLIENGSDVVIVVDGEGIVQMVTPTIEHALGYTAAEIVGMGQSGLIHPDDETRATALFAELGSDPGGERRDEVRIRHRDGDWRSFEMVMQNRLDDPSVLGTVISLRDVTEQRRLRDEQARLYAELEAEFSRAAEIQAQLLPHAAPDLPGYEFAGTCLPARQVGGDFYDWLPGDDAIRLSLGDVMGKGMPASLLTATVRAALRAVEDLPVSAAVEAVNRALSPDLIHTNSFVTLFHAALEPTTGELTYVDAGHGMVFIQRRDGAVEPLRQRGLPLGVLPDATYPAGTIMLQPGDTLVIYSDGLPDARPELLLDAVGVAGHIDDLPDAQAKLERLVSLVSDIQSRPDDLTLVLLRRREELTAIAPAGSMLTEPHCDAIRTKE